MSKPSVGSVLLRGTMLGLLTTFINGLSLPILLDLFGRILTALDTGTWYSGPGFVAELCLIFFVLGTAYSFLPGVIAGIVLVLGIQSVWAEKTHRKGFRTCAGMAIGIAAAVCYVLLMFNFDPMFSEELNLREDGLLAVFILVEQVIIYGWLATRLSAHQQAQ